ncbi:unnamed protein product [Cuscuta campestris]|uniref:CCHC-type domain-containing protein n=1 Tax=Cuscuta campestris TaxID=132261 RepID=A0A484LAZ1_9ASTE|nr:unnamed protein product [Cuscuta campestris]
MPAFLTQFLQQMANAPMFQPPPPRQITLKTLKDNGAEEFHGDRISDPQIELDWIEQTERVLKNLSVLDARRPELAFQLLRKGAYEWWKRADEKAPKPWTWEHFDWAFKKEYIPARFREEKRTEFMELKQGDMTLPELRQKFDHLAQFATTLVSTPADRIEEFRKRLRPDIRPYVSILTTTDFSQAYDLMAKAEKDVDDYKASLKAEEAGPSTRPTASAPPSAKRPAGEVSNSSQAKKGKTVVTQTAPAQSVASSGKSNTSRFPPCATCGRTHPGECWQGLGKLCEGSGDLRKQKIEVLLEKFKSFKMLPGESFDMLDERFHKILNDLASLNHVLSPKEKNVRTYEHELKKKKEEQVTPFPTALITTPKVPSSEGTCPRNCDTPSSSQPSSSKMENYDEDFAMMVKQFWKFKKFFKKTDSVRRPSKGKPQVSDSPPKSYLCYNCRKPGHWKSACPYPKVEKYGERERNEKKKKGMVAAESDESSSSSSDEEALVCMERRAEKSNHEDMWTMSEDDHLCLMAKDDAEQEVTSQTSCSSSYESIPTSENLFDQFKKMMEDFEEINLKHSSLTEENKLLSEENLKLTEGRKSQLNEITQLKTENESLSEKVKSLNKELGILKSKEAVDKLLETTNHKGRKGLGFDPSSSKRKGRTTFIPPKPTAKPNKQKGKEKDKPTEVPKKVVPPKNYRKLDRPQRGNNFRRKPSNPHYTRGFTHYGVDRSFPRNSEWRTMPRYSHPPPQKLFVPPKYVHNRHRSHYAQPRQNYRSYRPRFPRRKQEIAPPARRKFYAYNYDYNPNKFRAARKIPCNFKLDEAAKYPDVWYLDSGCSRHMTGDASLLSNLIPYNGPRVTFGESNDFVLTKGLGNLVYKGLTIQAVSYVEGLNYNLLSISQFCDKGYSLEFCKDMASLKNISTNEVILTGKRIRNIYEVIWDDVKEACLISKVLSLPEILASLPIFRISQTATIPEMATQCQSIRKHQQLLFFNQKLNLINQSIPINTIFVG